MTRPAGELTFRAAVLGCVLSVLLSAANAYLGLFAGMTVSASIPAAVVSMAVLRGLRGSMLENNLVQTAASAGESAAAGAIFTLPALVLLGVTARIDYPTATLLVGTGGVLGVLFTIPLRRALVVQGDLPFPEGVATAEVLKAGHGAGGGESSVRPLLWGAGYGALCKLLSGGLRLGAETVEGAVWLKGGALYAGTSLSPALAAVGAIVGVRVAALLLAGGVINWLLFVPFVSAPAESSALEAAAWIWSTKTRYLGVGAMAVGGLWTLVELRHALWAALRLGGSALRSEGDREDLSGSVLAGLMALCAGGAFFALYQISDSWPLSVLLLVLVFVFGFLFCGVAAYMAGLVGSSNNPVSGVTIATILLTSVVLLLCGFSDSGGTTPTLGSASAILVGTMVCTAAALGGDNMQDLKAGHLLGARPARQQIVQLLGVVCASLVLVPVLNLLADAYGFGPSSAEHPHALRAPQATLMASVARGVFRGDLPWTFVAWGSGIAGATIGLDHLLRWRGVPLRLPVLALAVGIYLPVELTLAMMLGALAARSAKGGETGRLLCSAGLITGEALLGIALAVAVAGSFDLSSWLPFDSSPSRLLGVLLLLGSLGLLRSSWGRRAQR